MTVFILFMSKPPLGIGVKRNDLRPWRALAPIRLSWGDPSCGNRWLPEATPPAAPPRPTTTTTALLTWARRRLQLRPPVCAQTSPRRPANLSQAAPARLPDAFQTPPRRLPAVSPAVSQTSPSRLPDGSQRGGGHQKAPNGPKLEKRHFSVLGEKESKNSGNEHNFHLGTPKKAKWALLCILAPKVRKNVPETVCLISLLGQGAK